MSPTTDDLAEAGLAEQEEAERLAKKARSRAQLEGRAKVRAERRAESLGVVDRHRLVRPSEAARLRGVGVTTVRRQLKDKAVRLGEKSIAYRLFHVLELPES
jgi:hypothetical protein